MPFSRTIFCLVPYTVHRMAHVGASERIELYFTVILLRLYEGLRIGSVMYNLEIRRDRNDVREFDFEILRSMFERSVHMGDHG
jgi:hypothetical protein